MNKLPGYFDPYTKPPGYNASPFSLPRPDKYYDDNSWIGLNQIEAYHSTWNHVYLAQAERTFRFVMHGWSTDENQLSPGGLVWGQKSYRLERNLVTNAAAAQLAVHLYNYTGQRHYLKDALRLYNWIQGALYDPYSNLYWEKIGQDGSLAQALVSCDQGLMVGLDTLLHQATGEAHYLDQTGATAKAALAHFDQKNFSSQRTYFVALFFQNLALLQAIRPDPMYISALENYTRGLNSNTNSAGLLPFGSSYTSLQTETAAAQVNALLARELAG